MTTFLIAYCMSACTTAIKADGIQIAAFHKHLNRIQLKRKCFWSF